MYSCKNPSILILVLTSLLLAGCAGKTSNRWQTSVSSFSTQSSSTKYTSSHQNTPYTVGQGDRLQVGVFGEPALTGEYAVDGTGTISMPLLRSVRVAGLTIRQVAQRITTRLRKKFLRNPSVSVEVTTFRPFYILGEVTNSGQYPYVDGMDVQTAVAIAGGFTPRARQSRVKVTRKDANNRSRTLTLRRTATLQPGDTIVVEERFF